MRQLRFGDWLIMRRSVSAKPIPLELMGFLWHVYHYSPIEIKGSHWQCVHGTTSYEKAFEYVSKQPQ